MINSVRHYHLGCGERLQTSYQSRDVKKCKEAVVINRVQQQQKKSKDKQRV
jgi:hypothetical protein